MRAATSKIRIAVRASFWIRPLGLLLGGALAGYLLPYLEQRFLSGWGFAGADATSPSGARAVLSVAAGTLATALTVTISMTMVTVQLAASQYSSRIVRRFLSDRASQHVVGTFLAIIAFLFLVLRSIRSPDEGEAYIPILATTLGLAVSIGGLALLVFFVHRTMRSVQASTVIAGIGVDTIRTIEGMKLAGKLVAEPPARPGTRSIGARHPGYVQLVADNFLAGLGRQGARRVVLAVSPGDFRLAGEPLATIELAPGREMNDALAAQLQSAFVLGRERSNEADPRYGVRQLVDVALRALSPGINDPTTAVMVVHELAAVLCAVWRRSWWTDGWMQTDQHGCEIVRPHHGLPAYLDEVLLELTRFAREQPRVAAALVELLGRLTRACPAAPGDQGARELVRERATHIWALATPFACDRHERAVLDRALANLETAAPPGAG